jgi:hypothetical protein
MQIRNLFERDIFRPINGVVKADQLDDSSVWQELDEFVVTKELEKHLRDFFSNYCDALKHKKDSAVSGKIGVWISGFFGSGKSHFLKVLSYLLRNRVQTHDGQQKKPIEFFESKIRDAMLFGDIKNAVDSDTDVILFNIDSKAGPMASRDAILTVFLRVLNEMQGYSGDYPHVAHMERYLENKGKLEKFKEAFREVSGSDWVKERDAYHFHRDDVIKALTATIQISTESAEKWIDGAESSFALTIENFCKWVKEYLDSKGPDHRLIFLVDEVGQFIGTDSHLMLNLQTITEELGTICGGRAWIVVTSQEDIDAVVGEMKQSKANDFSKIQGRFRTRLSLSSANVDEVIQERLLAKRSEVVGDLETLFKEKGDILKNQLSFSNCGMTLKTYKDPGDFAKAYPFAPYQFQLVQKIFEAVRRVGATGLHLSRGERSTLDAFQSAAKEVALQEVGILVPLYRFYSSIESFLDTAIKKTIDQAEENASLEHPFDTDLLKVLFLIRYVEEMKGNVDNLVTLCLSEIDADRLALRGKIEASLARLEKETLIKRSGDVYYFLTNEERDINKEIKAVEISGSEEAKLLGEIVFSDVLKEQRKYRYSVNKMDFTFNRTCDLNPIGNRADGALLVSAITPLNDAYESYDNAKCILESSSEGGHIIIKLGNDESLGREIRTCIQTGKYVRHKNDGTLPESAKRILRSFSEDNQERRNKLVTQVSGVLTESEYYAAGQKLNLKSTTAMLAVNEALDYLVQNTFTKMGYLKVVCQEPLKEVQAVLRSNDIGAQTLALKTEEGNKQAMDDVRNYVALMAAANRPVILSEMMEKRYSLRPYGWPDDEVLLLVVRLIVLGEISLKMDGALLPIDKIYEAITGPAKRRKIAVIKRQTTDPAAIQDARSLGKELFHEMGPDGEDALYSFLLNKLKGWQASLSGYKPLADTGAYPGKDEIDLGLALLRKLLTYDNSYKFIEQLNSQKADLLKSADNFNDLEQFYERQKPTWEKLRKASEKFQLNRLEIERDASAGPALARMQEILAAPRPYSLIKEAEGLILAVSEVNTTLVTARRLEAVQKINGLLAKITSEVNAAAVDVGRRSECVKPLETLKGRVQTEESLAHITQAESEALKEYDSASLRIEEFINKPAAPSPTGGTEPLPKPVIKKKRVVEPSKLVATTYLETKEDADRFIETLRTEIGKAIASGERVEIR